MTAILTKYLGPTDHKGARIKAWSVGGRSVTIPYPHELSGEACYRAALDAWIERYEPGSFLGRCEWVGGETEEGYAFCPNAVCVEGAKV